MISQHVLHQFIVENVPRRTIERKAKTEDREWKQLLSPAVHIVSLTPRGKKI
jgi:hypothetical protein